MIKNIFITGSTGFSGKSLSSFLISKKLFITKTAHKTKSVNTRKLDLTKKIFLKNKIDCIIHTAAFHKINDFTKNKNNNAKKNILMVKNLVYFAKQKRIKNFIFY